MARPISPNLKLGKPFKKGQSGNPKGRPPKLPGIDELIAKVLGEEKSDMTAAEAILRSLLSKATKGDVRAAEVLLERGWGKVKNQVDVTSQGKSIAPPTINVYGRPPEEG